MHWFFAFCVDESQRSVKALWLLLVVADTVLSVDRLLDYFLTSSLKSKRIPSSTLCVPLLVEEHVVKLSVPVEENVLNLSVPLNLTLRAHCLVVDLVRVWLILDLTLCNPSLVANLVKPSLMMSLVLYVPPLVIALAVALAVAFVQVHVVWAGQALDLTLPVPGLVTNIVQVSLLLKSAVCACCDVVDGAPGSSLLLILHHHPHLLPRLLRLQVPPVYSCQ